MGRCLQYFAEGEYYHVYNRGNDKRTIFLDASDYSRFLALLYICNNTRIVHLSDYVGSSLHDILSLSRGEMIVDIGAYCLMPNHFHFLLREKKEGGISAFMQKLSTGYTMYFNKKHHRSGSLFEGVFKSKHVDIDEYLKYLFSYIHLNPVKIIDSEWKEKGLNDLQKTKEFLEKYEYSSYLDFIGKTRPENSILSRKEFPDYFETAKDFEDLLNDWLTYGEDFGLEGKKPVHDENV